MIDHVCCWLDGSVWILITSLDWPFTISTYHVLLYTRILHGGNSASSLEYCSVFGDSHPICFRPWLSLISVFYQRMRISVKESSNAVYRLQRNFFVEANMAAGRFFS